MTGWCALVFVLVCQWSVWCVFLVIFKRFWVFVVYGLVEFAMQLGEVCKMFFSVAFGGSVLDGQ